MLIQSSAQNASISKNDLELKYSLTRKNVKNINVRVKPDGAINVSANHATAQREIEQFLLSKMDYLLKVQSAFKASDHQEPQPKQYVNGESFYILGKHLRLSIIESNKESVYINGTYIILAVRDITNYTHKKQLITKCLSEQCKDVFQEISLDTHKLFLKYGVDNPEIKVRAMKIRWGSCLTQKNIITLNPKLLEVPRNCIEYVVLHEYCHFIHPNHSKDFYAFVSMLMPDWKERKKQLELTQSYYY